MPENELSHVLTASVNARQRASLPGTRVLGNMEIICDWQAYRMSDMDEDIALIGLYIIWQEKTLKKEKYMDTRRHIGLLQ